MRHRKQQEGCYKADGKLQLKVVGKLQLKVVGKLQLKVFSWGCGRRFPERLLKIFESLPKVSGNFAVKVSAKFATESFL